LNSFTVEVQDGRLNLPLCVSSGQVFRWEQLEDGRWLGVDGAAWFLVRITGDRFEVESNVGREAFERLFRLDWDAHEIERRILERAPELEPAMAGLRGLRLLRPSDAYEVLFSFLCTPNNHLNRIVPMVRRLAGYGPMLGVVAGREVHVFPRASVIAEISEEELRAQGFGYRGRSIPLAAARIVELGAGWLEGLRSCGYREARAALCSVPGIGPKLADCICLFALDHTEAVPVDTHLWQAVTGLYRPEWRGKALTSARYEDAAGDLRERFGELAGWAHQYLFYRNLLARRAGELGSATRSERPAGRR